MAGDQEESDFKIIRDDALHCTVSGVGTAVAIAAAFGGPIAWGIGIVGGLGCGLTSGATKVLQRRWKKRRDRQSSKGA